MILTLDEAKTLLKITGTDQDEYLSTILPMVESDIIHYTKNDFGVVDMTSTKVLDQVITSDNSLKSGDTILFLTGINADIPFTVASATPTEITIVELIDSDIYSRTFVKVKYPKGLKLVASNMVNFKLTENVGIKSETIGQYSVEYDKLSVAVYPQETWNALMKYSKYYKRSEA